MDDITNLDSIIDRPKVVLMVPKSIRPKTLFIDKQVTFDDVSDLCDPSDRNAKNRPHTMANYQSRMHTLWQWRSDLEGISGGVITARLRGAEKNSQASSSPIGTIWQASKR
jgi:hypothetical protein